ncbi:conjugal transfer protein [Streptococcus agalactiae]|uniref:conjugal transfer protein n=1 Tax=Streptococcus agalactiae TaxID=1311 RepID=UPI00081078A5|nr:conjugal transfer protein [Streptococcus agalactiae]OCM02413.1 transposase [Streptococcus agalactiae]
MNKLKTLIQQVTHYLSRFKKQGKKRGSPKLIKTTRKNVNILVLTGLGCLVFIGATGSLRAITLSSKVTSLEKEVKKAQSSQVVTTSTDTDYRLTYYLNDFVAAYFSFSDKAEEQEAQIEKLNSFYDVEPEIKSQGQKRTPMSLVSARLLLLTENTATYQVTYKQKIGDKEEEITTGFNIPYATKNSSYYVSGLPWYSSLSDNQAKGFDKESALRLTASDNLPGKTHKKVKKFLNVFFTNYTTDQDNLDLVGKDLVVLENTTFKSLDYVYLTEDGDTITAYVQVTFEVAGNTRSENFALTLTPKGNSYYVTKVAHIIPKDYAKHEGE